MNLQLPHSRGVPFLVLLFALMVLALVQKTESITDAEKQAIKKGLQTGKAIFGVIKKREFQETLTKVATSASQFLGVLGPFIGFVMAFIPSQDSAELSYMKTMMGDIDDHFDRVDSRFDDVERMVDWVEVAVNLGQIQQYINAVDEEYRLFYQSDAPSDNRKAFFINSYENTYQLSGTILYQAITTKQGTFNEDLGESIMRYTKNDRNKTEDFLLGILDILMQAQRIELGYLNVKGWPIIEQEREDKWKERMQELVVKYGQIDNAVKDNYLEQSKADAIQYANDNKEISKEEFNSCLYSLLVSKYYWREWFVLVYDAITGSKNHFVSVCGGHKLFGQSGRNIVIASKDKLDDHMLIDFARVEVNKFEIISPDYNPTLWYIYPKEALPTLWYSSQKVATFPDDAELIFNTANKVDACSFAVVKHTAGINHKASENRVAINDLGPHYFKIYMFI